jgi:hypothetical protein
MPFAGQLGFVFRIEMAFSTSEWTGWYRSVLSTDTDVSAQLVASPAKSVPTVPTAVVGNKNASKNVSRLNTPISSNTASRRRYSRLNI